MGMLMNQRNKNVTRVAVAGIAGNMLLLGGKLSVGLFSGSQAMIADGLNSAGDVFSSVMTLVGSRLSAKPGDEDHPYGHGKAEYIFSLVIALSLLLVAYSIFMNGLKALSQHSSFLFTPWLVVVALGTIAMKISLFFYANRVGKRYDSLLAIANAQDHRNDVFITLLTLVSIVTGYFNLFIIDALGGMLIGLWIAYTGFDIFSHAYKVLMDKNIDPAIHEKMSSHVEEIPGVDHVDAITAKPVGLEFLLMVKVSVDANLTVFEGHEISSHIKRDLMDFPNIADVIVHINPAQFHP